MEGVLYFLSVLALIQGTISLKNGFRNKKYALNYSSPRVPDRPTIVFCPVRGVSRDLEATIASLCAQTHTRYRIVFVVDSERDAAFDFVSNCLRSQRRGEVLVAGQAADRGQKVHNLAYAVGVRGADAETFVFCDADAWFPPNWLRLLVAPLDEDDVGAATGYRWYVPPPSSLPSRIRSSWNASVAGFLGPHQNNFTWGGSTAIRREVFEAARVLDFWRGALSDDYALTRAVRDSGRRVVFVPSCLVPSYETCAWRGLFEFTTRQIQITRVYAPRVWVTALVSYSLFNLTFFWITLSLFEGLSLLPLWVGLYGLAGFRADLRLRAARRSIADGSLHRHRWFYRLSPPLVALLYEWNLIVSIFRRTIVWKGIRYRLISPSETVIER
jgi:ceramide glucosyltransferase